jgi:hypothetical protein
MAQWTFLGDEYNATIQNGCQPLLDVERSTLDVGRSFFLHNLKISQFNNKYPAPYLFQLPISPASAFA